MSKPFSTGFSLISMLVGISLITVAISGAIKLMGLSLTAQNDLNNENLVDQVNRISEIFTVHVNRGGSYQNADVQAKGIQLCSLKPTAIACNGYNANQTNFCLSLPTRVSKGGRDVINLTGFRLFNGVLAQREAPNTNMATFDHGEFCKNNADWKNLNNQSDFEFTAIRLCRFEAKTVQQVTQNYEQNCKSVIENDQKSNMFWLALFKAKIGHGSERAQYEESRVIQLLNTTRVRVGA